MSPLLVVLVICCLTLATVQAAEWGWPQLLITVAALTVASILCGELASRTSVADVTRWLQQPQRRLDLAALLLVEVVLYGTQAVEIAQRGARPLWRALDALPAPSLLLTLFGLQVAAMLLVDGVSFAALSVVYSAGLAVLAVATVRLMRWLLPDTMLRSGLRLLLYAMQASIAVWLAQPLLTAPVDPVAAMATRLSILLAIAVALAVLGWTLQRRSLLD